MPPTTLFSQLPSMFNRNFATAYLVPVVLFVAASFGLLADFGLLSSLFILLTTDSDSTDSNPAPIVTILANPAAAATIIAIILFVLLVVLWLLAITLLAANRAISRLLAGYGRFNPARLLAGREKRRYQKLLDERNDLENAHQESNNQAKQAEIQSRLGDLYQELAEQFPDSEEFLLPTRFGNTMRAFETGR